MSSLQKCFTKVQQGIHDIIVGTVVSKNHILG